MDIYRYNYDPVTIEEFLNDKYLGENTVGFIFPWVKETLFEFFDPHKKYRELYLMQGNGVGKTTLMNIALAYMVYLYCSCKQIREQLGVTSSAIVEIVILSDRRGLALERVWAKLVEDFDKYPVFERVARAVEARVAGGTILWSTASVGNRTFVGTFPNGLRLSVEKRYEGIQGKNIIGVVASELSNFSLDSGVSSEEVDKLLMGAIDRIHTRGFLQHYIPRVIIDSTPHDTKTSMLDRRVFETKELFSNDIRIVKTGESWLYNKKESIYPVYCKTGETFSVFCGDAERNPRVVSGEVVSRYAEDSVVQVPVDLRETFDLNPEHLVRVWCGRPTGIAGRYGVEEDLVLKIFDRNLPSVSRDFVDCVDFEDYNFIQDLEKSGVIRQSSGLLEYVRSPYEARVIHCDIAVVRDACAISCVHLERDESIEEMLHCVVDWMLVPNTFKCAGVYYKSCGFDF